MENINWISVAEAARKLNASKASIRNWINKGLLKANRPVGTRTFRIHPNDFYAFVNSQQDLNPSANEQ